MELKFSDNISFKLDGDYRIERRSDGLYVVGNGFLCAVDSYEEGKKMINSLR